VSLDGLSTIDFPHLRRLPLFRRILDSGAFCRRVRGIYPTQTYPLHASLITGTYPLRHGIYANTLFQPGRSSPDWHWYRRFLKAPPLYDIARRAGLTTATLLWPSAGRSANRYVIPEIKKTRPGQSFPLLVLSGGTFPFILHMLIRYGSLLKSLSYSHLDDLTTAVACRLIRKRKTELLLAHLLDLDGTRHRHGFRSREAEAVLADQDRRLGRLLEACRLGGGEAETAFVVFGDHAYRDVHTRIRINAAFRKAGLLDFDRRGKLARWQAWANCCEGSAQVTLQDPEDAGLRRRVEGVFSELRSRPEPLIETVYDRARVLEMKVGEGIHYILEAAEGCYFVPQTEGEVVAPAEESFRAAHGYHPDHAGYRSLFIASGPGVRTGVEIEEMGIVDIGPTLAALLGLEMPGSEGRIVKEILEEEKP
jgi:predicted AlkP superfamily pyrophosphatase or phosphodiesterase